MEGLSKTAVILRNIARYMLLVLALLTFVFALLSGAEDYGDGLRGILRNSPNALPWLALPALVWFAWKRELSGGILVTLLGLFLIWFFNIRANHFYAATFILTLLVTLMGCFLILSGYLKKMAPGKADG